MAWGRIAELPEEITNALKSKAQGGSGAAAKFVEYCERETRKFQ
jgi:retinol dehydrogenase-12